MHTELRHRITHTPGRSVVYLAEVDRQGTPIRIVKDDLGYLQWGEAGLVAMIPGVFRDVYSDFGDAFEAIKEALVTNRKVVVEAPIDQLYLMTVGEYDDYSVIGVHVGTLASARKAAETLTQERVDRYSADMVKVRVERTELIGKPRVKRTCVDPGLGGDIRTYTVDQLLEQAGKPGACEEQLMGEIIRRARVLDGEQAESD